MKVKVCDALCGAGKTVSCINMMNSDTEHKYIFVTPYLNEVNKLLQVRRVLSEHANEPIPTMLAYKILKFMKSSDTEGAFYDAKLQEIIEQYGKRDESGKVVHANGRISIDKEHIEECQIAIDELGETEIEAPHITFTIHELTPINFSVSELYSLDEIIIEEG